MAVSSASVVFSAPSCSGPLSARHNTPEEHDETMSAQEPPVPAVRKPDPASDWGGRPPPPPRRLGRGAAALAAPDQLQPLFLPAPSRLSAGPTPYPSQAAGGCLHPSFASSWSGYPNSLPSCLSQKDQSSFSEESCLSRYKSFSLPGRHSPDMMSLEQPFSLRSNPPLADFCHHTLSPYSCPPQAPLCCGQWPADAFSRRPAAANPPWPQYHQANGQCYPGDYRLPGADFSQLGPNGPAKERPPAHSTPLSLEQRKVFVTYEADSDKHVSNIINFVALLRHNGFDTHIDIFEQQFRSISKIDFMERYLTEKEYLIIIIISPKYYETVTASPFELENDERTFNTVYIHKQLQSEFIQNGSKNFRFIPILFPGAKKCHVPNWLQNTHVYAWPRDRDDILRRLMRVEKYNPPPIGELPTIVSIPI
ncbi:unnamed protein product [Menidia menidia]|uniref:E3 ubiquitin ligase TRAF3IP2 n=1 Tax=Menidia menidia TaxID=238744 RepID=A0A8S4AD05_9TELE|nr:unnamed protein product [Menidia menidia]